MKKIRSNAKNLEFIKKFKINSSLTEEDALRLGKELNKNMALKRFSANEL